MSNSLFDIQNVTFKYALDSQWVTALNGVSGKIEMGQITCLTGPSGSGKSTLLNLLGMIEPVQEGEIQLQGKSYRKMTEADKNHVRRFDLGFIFQTFHLFPVLSAEENVAYFLHKQNLPASEIQKRANEALDAVGLSEHKRKRPLEMSGGQRQRVAIARAIAKRPKVLIADEPTASLDQKTGRAIMALLRDLKISILVSSHDPMVIEYADRQIKLFDGELKNAV